MDRVDAQKAFRKRSALIEINLGIDAVAGRPTLNHKGCG
jgi:hypothetical protein